MTTGANYAAITPQLRRSFADHAYLGESDFIRFSVTVGDLQLIALDTTNTGASNDFYAQLDWAG